MICRMKERNYICTHEHESEILNDLWAESAGFSSEPEHHDTNGYI